MSEERSVLERVVHRGITVLAAPLIWLPMSTRDAENPILPQVFRSK